MKFTPKLQAECRRRIPSETIFPKNVAEGVHFLSSAESETGIGSPQVVGL